MKNLIDSSAWIEYFRGNKRYQSIIDDLIDKNAICTNDIILAELLPSILHRNEHNLVELLDGVKKCPLTINWQEICEMQLLNFEHGNYRIGILDIIIAQNCIQNELKLVECDKHFEVMAGYMPLKLFLSER